ncbi:MAG: PAS domain S-box protein, partial [Myxococcales bacterium]
MTLPDMLEEQGPKLIEAWSRRVAELVVPRTLTRDELVDGMLHFIEELSRALRAGTPPERPGAESQGPLVELAHKHAAQRLALEFELPTLVSEYHLLRDCILSELASARFVIDVEEVRRLCRHIDCGAMRVITAFMELREQREQQMLGAMQKGRESAESALDVIQSAKAALKESEERFRLLVQSVKDYGVFMVATDGTVSGWNQGAERLKGYQAEEIIGASIARFFPPDEASERVAERLIQRAAEEDQSEYEGWMVRKDGSRFWATVSLYAVRDDDGRLRGFSNVARDNSARKEAEELRQFLSRAAEEVAGSLDYQSTLERLARVATERLADWCAIFVLDEGSRNVVVAHASESKEAVLRKAITRLPQSAPGERGVAEVARTGKSELCADTHEAAWVRRALGVATPEAMQELGARSYMCVPLRLRGETFAVMALVSTTPRRRYDAGDLAIAEELARRGALSVENARLYHEAQQAIRARDEFISMASHELRTPLNGLGLYVHKLLRIANGSAEGSVPGAVAKRELEKMGMQVRRLVSMMDSLLDITTISAGRLELHVQRLDLGELARDCIARFSEELVRAGCEVRLHAPEAVTGNWDRFRLEQV